MRKTRRNSAAPVSNASCDCKELLQNSLRHNAPLLIAGAAYLAVGTFLIVIFGELARPLTALLSWSAFIVGLAVGFFLLHAGQIVLVMRPRRPLPMLIMAMRRNFTRRHVADALPVVLLIGPFGVVFAQIKSLIPSINPFNWDASFVLLEAWLHGGYQPWVWLAPYLLNGPLISITSLLYTECWPLLGFMTLAHAILCIKRPALRMQFLLSYFGCWGLLGTVAAVIMSSAGPAFYGDVIGEPNPFSPLMNRLAELDQDGWITSVPISDLLWQAYELSNPAPIGLGISAMPSLHVSLSCLFFLYARRFGKTLGILTGVYLVSTLVGSVVLGWHYAIDGYAAILATLLIWRASGALARRFTDPPPPGSQSLIGAHSSIIRG